jgi:drug/metabolite transporter (DMT)-like permease
MSSMSTRSRSRAVGLLLAGAGVLIFSLTLPATQLAVEDLSAWTVGIGRAVVAAALAGVCLLVARAPFPGRQHLRSLSIVGFGVVLGFPIFTALALQGTDSAHAAVVIGLLPMATAIFGRLHGQERPNVLFWIACAAGAAVITVFTFRHGFDGIGPWDLFLVIALLTGGLGYAEGGRLAKAIPGWQVISWALLITLPVSLPATIAAIALSPTSEVSRTGWIGFAYVSVFSMFIGFCAWYPGLALVGIAKGSQLQLFQPLLTVGWASLLLGQAVDGVTLVAAVLVLLCVGASQVAKLATVAPVGKTETLAAARSGERR